MILLCFIFHLGNCNVYWILKCIFHVTRATVLMFQTSYVSLRTKIFQKKKVGKLWQDLCLDCISLPESTDIYLFEMGVWYYMLESFTCMVHMKIFEVVFLLVHTFTKFWLRLLFSKCKLTFWNILCSLVVERRITCLHTQETCFLCFCRQQQAWRACKDM